MSPTDPATLFFITPIGEDNSESRKRADNVLTHVLSPALGKKFQITRADKIVKPGSITHDVIEQIYESDLVVADLTGLNANVMYEVGVRHSFNLPIVQIAQKGQKLPFDIASERTILFDIGDLASVNSAKEQIKAAAFSAINEADDYSGPIERVLNNKAVFRNEGDVGAAIEALSFQLQSYLETMSYSAHPDYDGHKLEHVYSIFSSLQPYEADLLIDKLRKLCRS